MNVAVSAYATDLGITPRGSVDFPAIGGGDFVMEAISVAREGDELPSAEAAVTLAAGISGRRVTALPELVAPFFRDGTPLDARWHLRLDRPTTLQTKEGRPVQTQDIYISRIRQYGGSRVWTDDVKQPSSKEVMFVPMTFVGENYDTYFQRELAEMRPLSVARRSDAPINFVASQAAR
jgi:hypothetical protein